MAFIYAVYPPELELLIRAFIAFYRFGMLDYVITLQRKKQTKG